MEYFKSISSFNGDCANKKVIILSGITVATTICLYTKCRGHDRRAFLRDAIRKRQSEREDQLRKIAKTVAVTDKQETDQREAILALSFPELFEALQNETYSALQVLHAYQEKALKAHAITNCITQFFLEAEECARQLDQAYVGKKKPPLFGIPFSVKESISVKGYDSTAGYSAKLGHPADEDATCVAVLRAYGAVPFVQTNVPQTLLSYNNSNPIYGRTTNPFNVKRTSGGSSGGEGALIGSGGSPLGLGTDVGGSIRIPSHFCGIAGIKPTTGRISQLNSGASTPGRPVIRASIGPMAPTVDALIAACRLLFSDAVFAIDQQVAPIPFKDDVLADSKPLTIGWFDTDGYFEPTHSCRRAVREAKQALERSGHKLVQWTPPNAFEAFEMAVGALTMDGGDYIMTMLSDECSIDELLAPQLWIWGWPNWLKRWLAHLVPPRIAQMLRAQATTPQELRHLYARIEQYRTHFAQSMRDAGIDAILCPAFTTPSISHALAGEVPGNITYTVRFNLLDYPAGIVKVGNVTAADEQTTANEYPESDIWYVKVKKENTNGSLGLPVGVQVAAAPFREEIVLKIMRDIEQNLMKE
uniref:fatty acid amide hydrolase n=1 Tax=Plectus sambesii TaxID=2011161 RepID=A0A914W0X5_9BILA